MIEKIEDKPPSEQSKNESPGCDVFRPKYFNFRPRDEDEEEIFFGVWDVMKTKI